MSSYILDGFNEEMEKIALTRYAIEDHSDEGGDSQFLHRKAGYLYDSGRDYVSSRKKGSRKKIGKYKNKTLFNDDSERVETSMGEEGNYDYQTSRALQPDPPIMEFK